MFRGILGKSTNGEERLIYQHPEAPDKCSTFVLWKNEFGNSVATCASCMSIYQTLPRTRIEIEEPVQITVVDGNCFECDPLAVHHFFGCSPDDFDKTTMFYSIMFACASYPAYLVEVCMSRFTPKHPIFLYTFTQDGTSKCYRFRSGRKQNSRNEFSIYCSGCQKQERLNGGKATPRVDVRKTDGFKLLFDPHSNHVAGCTPLNYQDVIRNFPLVNEAVKEKIIRGEDISMHLVPPQSPFSPTPVLHYPVSMCLNKQKGSKPIFVYRLLDDPSKCFKFSCKYMDTSLANGIFRVHCMSCVAYHNRLWRKGENQIHPVSRKVDGYYMLSEPCSDHQSGCTPYDYVKTLKNAPLVNDYARDCIIQRKEILGSPFLETEDEPGSRDLLHISSPSNEESATLITDCRDLPENEQSDEVKGPYSFASPCVEGQVNQEITDEIEIESVEHKDSEPFSDSGEPNTKRPRLH